jgi:hypothetical protein
VFVLRKAQGVCRSADVNSFEATAVPARPNRGDATFPAGYSRGEELIFIFSDVKLFF